MLKLKTIVLYLKFFSSTSLLKKPFLIPYFVIKFFLIYLHSFFKTQKLWISPLSIIVPITTKCNKSCSFCHYLPELNKDKSLDFSIEDFENLLGHQNFPFSGRICFYGGEPLINPNLSKFNNIAKSKHFLTSIITNGLLAHKHEEFLKTVPFDLITLSIYEEDFELIKKNITYLKGNINLSFVFGKENYLFIDKIIELAIRHKIFMITLESVRQTQSSSLTPFFEDDYIFLNYLKKTRTNNPNIIIRCSGLLTSSNDLDTIIQCTEPWDTLYINNKNQTTTCCQFPLETYSNPEKDILNTSDKLRIRHLFSQNIIPKECKGCHNLFAKNPLLKD